MAFIKRTALRFFFACEVIFFGIMYLFGVHGVIAWHLLALDVAESELACLVSRKRVKKLEKERQRLYEHPLYKERVIREQLQMAHKGDIVVYYDLK